MKIFVYKTLFVTLCAFILYQFTIGHKIKNYEMQYQNLTNDQGRDDIRNKINLSKKLLNLVPQGYYKNLEQMDLNMPIKSKDNSYDAIMCVGTFTYGHVKSHALDEFIRITKNNGLICFTINEGIYEEYGFDKKIIELSKNNFWVMKEFFKSDYIASKNVNAWLGIARIIK